MAKITRADLQKQKAKLDEHDLYKHLDYYEARARGLLIQAGYMTAQGEWVTISDPLAGSGARHVMEDQYGGLPKKLRARFLKYPEKVGKLKPVFRQAETILLRAERVRAFVSTGNAEQAALKMHDLMLSVFKAKGKLSSAEGGAGTYKTRKAIKAAAAKLVQEGYEATDIAWQHLKDLWQSGAPYFAGHSHINYVADPKGKGYFKEDDDDRTLTKYRTFDGYMREARKNFKASRRK